MSMNITLVIPVFRPQEQAPNLISMLEKVSKAFAKHPHYRLKILLLETQTTEQPLQHPHFQIYRLPQSEFDHGATRSLVQHLTQDEIILYLTQDVIIQDSQSIFHLIKPFQDPAIGATYGKQLPYPNATPFAQHLRYFNYPSTPTTVSYKDKTSKGFKVAFLSNAFAAYRRQALDKIGWFKAGLILGEDYQAAARLLKQGYSIAYVPQAQVIHSHNYTITEEFKRYFDIGVFHQMESWLLKEFGKPEGEGKRYLYSEFIFIIKHKHLILLPEFLIRNAMKYLGYTLGKHHYKLSSYLKKKLSMNTYWWS